MKYNLQCKFCSGHDTVNGRLEARRVMLNHLEVNHPQAYEQYKEYRKQIIELRTQINATMKDCQKELGVSPL